MTLRLNKSHKIYIAEKARQLSPLNQELTALLLDREQLAERIRVLSLGGEEKSKQYAAIAKQIQTIKDNLPEDIVSYGSTINMGNGFYVTYTGSEWRCYLSLPNSAVVSTTTYPIPKDSIVEFDLIALDTNIKNLRLQLRELQDNVFASISSITTVKKLLEQWAEAIELLPDELKQPKVLLPALQSSKLNKLIGLPTKKAKP